ncbi:DNA-directed RNA polymerase subunit beta [Evansella caseinilytica]|uniref:DNA-directed RNA polymerase subunit beta n=1 Tax=Evansella caseinilytica TaxID=1503961 RepID=A0A1H3TAD8_9BACI|nr:DNA-directed RNA polymerase subunit beta [Evansella caseinilytica]SDZ46289.1 DNA-directed RNA polymerase subunit beta [Evansella caseinilytica]
MSNENNSWSEPQGKGRSDIPTGEDGLIAGDSSDFSVAQNGERVQKSGALLEENSADKSASFVHEADSANEKRLSDQGKNGRGASGYDGSILRGQNNNTQSDTEETPYILYETRAKTMAKDIRVEADKNKRASMDDPVKYVGEIENSGHAAPSHQVRLDFVEESAVQQKREEEVTMSRVQLRRKNEELHETKKSGTHVKAAASGDKTRSQLRAKKQPENEQAAGKNKKRKGRIRLIPIWLRIIVVTGLLAGSLVAGAIVGYKIGGGDDSARILDKETWFRVYDFIYDGTDRERDKTEE